ncbi:MAG TPA: trigger factor [Bryobacteraceae bacterium]|nr:trigger factor [Bryobacteraceae bacterium]
MPVLEGCKHSLEIEVPVEEVQRETERVLADIQKKARLPGFRPGKAPASIIRSRFGPQIRQEVLEELLPKAFQRRAEQEHLKVVGTPNVSDVHFHENQPLRFKAEFEVLPEFELQEYRDLPVEYEDPQVTEEEVNRRLEDLRQSKADYINEDPHPIQDGDFAVVSLESIAGVEGEPIRNDEMMLHIGDPETLPEFTENLRSVTPGEIREFDVAYPEDYAEQRTAGKTVRFRVSVKGIRRKEVPELNDEFAQDLGDFQTIDELRDAIRKAMYAEKQYAAQRAARDTLTAELVRRHQFPVPEAWVERQIELTVENHVRRLAGKGVDPRKVRLDWPKIRESQRDRAVHEVKASLLLDRIADAEAIHATQDEVDREVQRLARAEREPVAAMRMKLEKDGALGRIANHIRTEKTLNFLFENARKLPKTSNA